MPILLMKNLRPLVPEQVNIMVLKAILHEPKPKGREYGDV